MLHFQLDHCRHCVRLQVALNRQCCQNAPPDYHLGALRPDADHCRNHVSRGAALGQQPYQFALLVDDFGCARRGAARYR